ncbi:DUF2441 domain-containing protein [Paenibacillus elgii]|uniref:DUF2441 domain-containing protein n=1 Tax=Paenibacillus elgii TaxID=189691 RepID=UPI000248C6BA|nr:DUF2441 domain-containing protein [Paenibacillus elgii]
MEIRNQLYLHIQNKYPYWDIGDTKDIGKINSTYYKNLHIPHPIALKEEERLKKLRRENILESVRLESYPEKPSRLKGLWVVPNEKCTMDWLGALGYNSPMIKILQVELTGEIHYANEKHIHVTNLQMNEIDTIIYANAQKYWKGVEREEANEGLFAGSVKVIEDVTHKFK